MLQLKTKMSTQHLGHRKILALEVVVDPLLMCHFYEVEGQTVVRMGILQA